MWSDVPSLREQIRDEFRACATPSGCVRAKSERKDAAGSDDEHREQPREADKKRRWPS